MALTLKDAIESDRKKCMKKLNELFHTGTDAEMQNFLKANSKKFYPKLEEFMLGSDNFKEIYNFDFSLYSPTGRYNNEIIANDIGFLPKVSKKISDRIKGEKVVYIDSYVSKLPGLNMKIELGGRPKNIGELPLIKGIIRASITNTHVAFYSFDNLRPRDVDWDKTVELYRELDQRSTLETAQRRLEYDYGNDKLMHTFLMLSDFYINEITKEIHEKKRLKKDQILLCLKAFDDVFEKELDRIHTYFDGLASFARLLAILNSSSGVMEDSNGRIDTYDLEIDETNSFFKLKQIPDDIQIDIEKLEMFGMLYRLTRVKKFGDKFVEMFLMRSSGWSHHYYEQNLKFCKEVEILFSKIKGRIQELFNENKEYYLELSNLSRSREMDADETKEKIGQIKKNVRVKISF